MSGLDDAASSTNAPKTPFSRFMNLPPELHILIANLLIFPDVIHLKLTCAYFNDLIPSLSHRDLLQAELTAFALAHDIYTCRYCLRLRPADKFADRMLRRRRGRYGRDAERRFCVECGLMPRSGTARYGPGAQIVIQGVMFVICMVCREFGIGVKDRFGKGMAVCENCWGERLARQKDAFEDGRSHLHVSLLGGD
ncbi:hypothetical protein BDV28DRAFT_127990 [Aspergillus coremiiformis]|uniref:F-box domain-containing protein n=1 Tax=Aspergillus coremiiformis TaxID=138285 RepID=A0A5N6ZGF0_9EURO|nr:hypothetical protein BDV28DRAFT_127990 [Aspergillus coremiiformis]